MRVSAGRPYAANYAFGSGTLAPSSEAAVDTIAPRLAGKHGAARRHTHRKHRQPRPVLQYVDEFE